MAFNLSTIVDMLAGGGEEGGIEKISTLSPEQQQIMSQLGQYLQGLVGQGLPAWGSSFTAPMTGAEQQGMSYLSNYLNQGVSPLTQQGLGTYANMLNVDPNQIASEYMKYQAPAEQAYLKNVSIPTMKESMVPGGTLRSTGTERGIADIISNFGNQQLSRIGQTIEGARGRAAGLLPQLGTMAGIEGGVPQMEAAFSYGQLPRMIEQAELTAQFEEFKRTTPELSPILDKLMSYLGITTTAAYNQAYTPSPFMQLLGSVAGIIGAKLGQSSQPTDEGEG